MEFGFYKKQKPFQGQIGLGGGAVSWVAGASAPPPGQQLFDTVGSTTWTKPAGVKSVSVVAVGGGGGGYGNRAGGGGGLGWKNDIDVTGAASFTVVVGEHGVNNAYNDSNGGDSYFNTSGTVKGEYGQGGGQHSGNPGTGYGGSYTGQGGGNGGRGGSPAGGGGGAAGYQGNGGAGGNASSAGGNGSGGAGGGGGGGYGGYPNYGIGSPGGGVGVNGLGPSGQGGATTMSAGEAGSGGTDGDGGQPMCSSSVEEGTGLYGAGGGSGNNGNCAKRGSKGAVRIIWPGDDRQFPSTRTADE